QACHVSMYSMFDDLLPPNHPYIKIHKQYKEVFGGANVVTISIEVKQGDIFNPATLSKIKSLTETIELTKGVNNYQIYSIARQKVKDIRSTAWGVEMTPVMWPNVPQTGAELVDLKNIIHANDMIWGQLVSLDDKAALITAVFWEGKVDYRYVFERFQSAKKSLEDGNTDIHFAGEPVLYGWIYHHLGAVAQIFCLTVLAILLVLVVSFRRVLGVVMPLISALVSAAWGVGLMGLLGYNFDPLILVVPFLISARTLSHSVQMTARYIEEYALSGDKSQAAKASFIGLWAPGSISIITDAAGLLVLAVAPIPLITKLAYVGCFWVMSNLVSVMVLNPVLLTYMPAPRRLSAEINGRPPKVDRFTAGMDKASKLCYGKISSWVIVAFAVLVAVFSFISLKDLTIGDARPGSPLLWPDSEYNLSVRDINKKFPGVDQLMVVVEGREADSVKTPEVLKTMEALEREVLDISRVGGAASLGSVCKKMNALLHYDHPSWLRFPETRMDIGMLFEMIQISSEPGDFDKWVNYNFKDSNIIVYLKDHQGNTIREVIQTI
ncbi:MAG: MMPL family transporter, partial [Syntrophales bacterium]|nr:MMPL family transporter [Syntrophales bacterium]